MNRDLARRHRTARWFRRGCLAATWSAVLLLGVLLVRIAIEGLPALDLRFLSSLSSSFPEKAGILPAIAGSLWLIGLTAAFAVPIGTAAAVYLEEYGGKGRIARIIDVNISNLAGVPSIVYGILGLALFVRTFGFGRSILSAALTMSLLILPVIVIAAREAIRAVPPSLRHAAFALGGTRWQTVRSHVLPAALPGICTGVILALSRAIGETAPLIMVGAAGYVTFLPEGPMDDFTALPMQIYEWTNLPQQEFRALAAAGILVLLAVLLAMNAVAVFLRQRARRRLAW